MTDKQPMHADGSGKKPVDGPEIAFRQGGVGESDGGAYPNPHTGKLGAKRGPESFHGRGGQSEIGYTGGPNPTATATAS